MPNYNISLNGQLAKIVEKEIRAKKYASRSEFFRDLVRRQYVEQAFDIQELSASDKDYKILQRRRRAATFIPMKELFA